MKVKIIKYRKLEWYEQGFSGKTGKLIFYQRNGKTFIRNAAKNGYNKIATTKQAIGRDRFKAALIHAKTILANPALKALYTQMAGDRSSAYGLAISEYMLMGESGAWVY